MLPGVRATSTWIALSLIVHYCVTKVVAMLEFVGFSFPSTRDHELKVTNDVIGRRSWHNLLLGRGQRPRMTPALENSSLSFSRHHRCTDQRLFGHILPASYRIIRKMGLGLFGTTTGNCVDFLLQLLKDRNNLCYHLLQ